MITAGHRLDDIRGYTLHQVSEFLAAIEHHNRGVRVGDAIAARMAQADGKAWGKYIRGLGAK